MKMKRKGDSDSAENTLDSIKCKRPKTQQQQHKLSDNDDSLSDDSVTVRKKSSKKNNNKDINEKNDNNKTNKRGKIQENLEGKMMRKNNGSKDNKETSDSSSEIYNNKKSSSKKINKNIKEELNVVLTSISSSSASSSVNNNLSESGNSKKSKKKVRIDETESLKVKQQIAENEPHFSTKELPAKIIKSKSNKNLTEVVKVSSPVTVQINSKNNKKNKIIEDVDVDLDGDSTSEESDLEEFYINKNAEKEAAKKKTVNNKDILTMSKEDQLVLVQRMEEYVPSTDTKSYKYRLRNLNWTKIAFKNYTIEECQQVWSQLVKKVRHYRLLLEILQDVQHVIQQIDLEELKPGKSKSNIRKHPDMPKRPLTSYFLYYIRKRDKLAKEKPDLDTVELNKYISEQYQSLPLEKKQKYDLLAAKNREEYNKQLEEFYEKHPEQRKVVIKKERKASKEKPPKRSENPFSLFLESELNKEQEIGNEDKAELKEICREKWKQISDEDKLTWINLAEERHKEYEVQLADYMSKHPEYTPKVQARKPILSRQDILLKNKLAGKPKKPPATSYALFMSMTLQSPEIASIPNKERWNYASIKWKAMTDEERDQYKQILLQVQEQYNKDFEVYLDSIPEDKRQAEILENLPKKRKNTTVKPSTSGAAIIKNNPTTNKVQQSTTTATTTKPKSVKQKLQDPIPPPRSAYKFFVQKYNGTMNVKDAWKKLSAKEKVKYEEELAIIKEKYIKDFETYLKSLSKKELAKFCANRDAKQEESSSDEDSESESEHGEEDSSGGSSNSSVSDNESDDE